MRNVTMVVDRLRALQLIIRHLGDAKTKTLLKVLRILGKDSYCNAEIFEMKFKLFKSLK